MALTLQTTLSRNPEIIASEIDDEIVMMSIEAGNYYGLNAIGSALWNQLEQQDTIENIINLLVQKFDVDIDQCKNDTLSFIEDMVNKKTLLVVET